MEAIGATIEQVLCFLKPVELLSMRCVSKTLRAASYSEAAWRVALLTDFGLVASVSPSASTSSYRTPSESAYACVIEEFGRYRHVYKRVSSFWRRMLAWESTHMPLDLVRMYHCTWLFKYGLNDFT